MEPAETRFDPRIAILREKEPGKVFELAAVEGTEMVWPDSKTRVGNLNGRKGTRQGQGAATEIEL